MHSRPGPLPSWCTRNSVRDFSRVIAQVAPADARLNCGGRPRDSVSDAPTMRQGTAAGTPARSPTSAHTVVPVPGTGHGPAIPPRPSPLWHKTGRASRCGPTSESPKAEPPALRSRSAPMPSAHAPERGGRAHRRRGAGTEGAVAARSPRRMRGAVRPDLEDQAEPDAATDEKGRPAASAWSYSSSRRMPASSSTFSVMIWSFSASREVFMRRRATSAALLLPSRNTASTTAAAGVPRL